MGVCSLTNVPSASKAWSTEPGGTLRTVDPAVPAKTSSNRQMRRLRWEGSPLELRYRCLGFAD
jgi:hypothetical protein